MRFWHIALALVIFWVIFFTFVYQSGKSLRKDYNICRDQGGSVGFCLTGFK